MNLSSHFTLDELTHSDTGKAAGIANRPGAAETESLRALCLHVLEPLREALGRSIKVNSGYRGPELNRLIKGAAKSQHLTGQAADIQSPGTAVIEIFKVVIRLGLPFDQVIYEANRSAKWVHVSHNPGANRGEIRVAQFGPDGRPLAYPLVTEQAALAMTEPATRSTRGGAEPGYIEGADEPEHEATEARTTGQDRAVAKKALAKKTVAKKATAKKATASKEPTVKTTAVRAPAPGARAAPRKATAKKAPAKAAATKKAAAGKVAVDKTATTKPAAKKPAAKKAALRKTAAGRAAQRPAASRKASPPAAKVTPASTKAGATRRRG